LIPRDATSDVSERFVAQAAKKTAGLARAVAVGAASVGVEVRLRPVAELNQELLISAKQYSGRHRSEIEHEPDARLEDIEWAAGIAFETPTRFGNVSAQPELFLDLARSRRLSPSTTPCATGGRSSFHSGTPSTRSSTVARTLTARPSPSHTRGPAWCAASFARRPRRAPKPSSCSQLPDDPASAPGNKSKRLSDTDCVRTSPDPGTRLILCKAWRMSRSLTASRLRPP
jgi:hypothetical protein